MFGFQMFQKLFNALDETDKNTVLRNIFSIYNVSFYNFFVRNNVVLFRCYDDHVFYQYSFFLESVERGVDCRVFCSYRIFQVQIFVQDYFWDRTPFSIFLHILLCYDEQKIKYLFQFLL